MCIGWLAFTCVTAVLYLLSFREASPPTLCSLCLTKWLTDKQICVPLAGEDVTHYVWIFVPFPAEGKIERGAWFVVHHAKALLYSSVWTGTCVCGPSNVTLSQW